MSNRWAQLIILSLLGLCSGLAAAKEVEPSAADCDRLLQAELHQKLSANATRRRQALKAYVARFATPAPTEDRFIENVERLSNPRFEIGEQLVFQKLAEDFAAEVYTSSSGQYFEVSPQVVASAEEREHCAEVFTTVLEEIKKQDFVRLNMSARDYLINNLVSAAAYLLESHGIAFRLEARSHLAIRFVSGRLPLSQNLARLESVRGIHFDYDPYTLLKDGIEAFYVPSRGQVAVPNKFILFPTLRNISVLHERRHGINQGSDNPAVQSGVTSSTLPMPGQLWGTPGFYSKYMSHDEADVYLKSTKSEIDDALKKGVFTEGDHRIIFVAAAFGLETAIRNYAVFKDLLARVREIKSLDRYILAGSITEYGADLALNVKKFKEVFEIKNILIANGIQKTDFEIVVGDKAASNTVRTILEGELFRRVNLARQRIYQYQLALKAIDLVDRSKNPAEQRALLLALNRSLIYRRTTWETPNFPVESPAELVERFNKELLIYRSREAARPQ